MSITAAVRHYGTGEAILLGRVEGSFAGFDYLALDPAYSGSCPCARFEVDGTKFEAHCWRVCHICDFAGLHYVGDRATAEQVLAAFQRMGWSEWALVEGFL